MVDQNDATGHTWHTHLALSATESRITLTIAVVLVVTIVVGDARAAPVGPVTPGLVSEANSQPAHGAVAACENRTLERGAGAKQVRTNKQYSLITVSEPVVCWAMPDALTFRFRRRPTKSVFPKTR